MSQIKILQIEGFKTDTGEQTINDVIVEFFPKEFDIPLRAKIEGSEVYLRIGGINEDKIKRTIEASAEALGQIGNNELKKYLQSKGYQLEYPFLEDSEWLEETQGYRLYLTKDELFNICASEALITTGVQEYKLINNLYISSAIIHPDSDGIWAYFNSIPAAYTTYFNGEKEGTTLFEKPIFTQTKP